MAAPVARLLACLVPSAAALSALWDPNSKVEAQRREAALRQGKETREREFREARLDESVPRPICVVDVPSDVPGLHCGLITQRFCDGHNEHLVREPTEDETECLHTTWDSCAVVGSAIHLLDADFGEEIDRHSVVIRMNDSPDGRAEARFGPKVGNRTDVRFANNRATQFYPGISKLPSSKCTFLHEPHISCPDNDQCYVNPYMCTPDCRVSELQCSLSGDAMGRDAQGQEQRTVIMDNVHVDFASRLMEHYLWKNAPPWITRVTAGFTAMTYALHHCRRVSVYGFGPTCSGHVGTRYFENQAPIHKNEHPYGAEFDVMQSLADGSRPSDALEGGAKEWLVTKEFKLHAPTCLPTSPKMPEQHSDDEEVWIPKDDSEEG